METENKHVNEAGKIYPMDMLPIDAKYKLYNLRLPDHNNVTIEKYLKFYNFIVVDDIVYVSDDTHCKKLLFYYFNASYGSIKKLTVPHAIIQGKYVIKNRFGYTSMIQE